MREKNLDIKWQFVVERAPWWGGAWERLVGVVKGLLRRTLGHAVLSWEELVTVLTEVEKVVNRRPITYLWESANPGGGVLIPLCPQQSWLALLAIRSNKRRKLRERSHLANAGEFNRRYLTCQISAILYADRGHRRKSQSLHRAHLAIFADRCDRRIKSPGVSLALAFLAERA